MPPAASVSVIILGTRRAALMRCLAALAAARDPVPREVLVVLNGAHGIALGDLAPWRRRLPLSVIALPAVSLGRARNAAIRLCRGEVLLFLDDDALTPPGYFAALEAKLREYPAAAALGGPNTTPAGSPRFSRWAGALLASPLGAGPMSRRYRGFPSDTWTDERALMLCNLALRRSVLDSERLWFPEEVDRNEENILLERLRGRGRLALHAPALAVSHERRAGVAAFLRQCAHSGLGRGQMTRVVPLSLRPVHTAPLALALLLAAACLGSGAAAACVAGYAFLVVASACSAAAGTLDRAGVAALTPAAHLSYAAGFAAGLAGARAGPAGARAR